jgi:hypothetical protein
MINLTTTIEKTKIPRIYYGEQLGSRYLGVPLDDLNDTQAATLVRRGYFKTMLADRLHPYTSYHCTIEKEIYRELGDTLGLMCNISHDLLQYEIEFLCRLFGIDPKGINQIYGISHFIISLDRNEFINADQSNFKQPIRDAIFAVIRSSDLLRQYIGKSVRYSYSLNGVTEIKIVADTRGNDGLRMLRNIEHLPEFSMLVKSMLDEIKHAYSVHLSQLQLSEVI